jgi:hypothetical protein
MYDGQADYCRAAECHRCGRRSGSRARAALTLLKRKFRKRVAAIRQAFTGVKMIKRSVIVRHACLSLALYGCIAKPPLGPAAAPSTTPDTFAISADDCTRDSAATLTRADADRDLAALSQILEGAYAPLRAHPELGGVPRVLADVRTALGAGDAMPVTALQDAIARALGRFPDGHLGVARIVGGKLRGDDTLEQRYLGAYTTDLRLELRDGRWRVQRASDSSWVGSELVSCAEQPLRALIQPTVETAPLQSLGLVIVRSATPFDVFVGDGLDRVFEDLHWFAPFRLDVQDCRVNDASVPKRGH